MGVSECGMLVVTFNHSERDPSVSFIFVVFILQYFSCTLCFMLQVNPTLTSLKFGRESISAGGASQICAALRALSTAECLHSVQHITRLVFSDNYIGDAGLESCSELIRVSKWLQELHFANCHLSSRNVVSLLSALRTSTSIEHLNLVFNHGMGLDGFRAIGAFLSVDSSLKILDLGGNDICGHGFQAIAEGLKINRSLQELHFKGTEMIDIAAAGLFADALRLNSSLRRLNLSVAELDSDSAELLSAALCVNSGLEHLDLSNNEIGDRGAASFRAALSVNTGLRILDLSRNCIRDPGIVALGFGLVKNSSLTCLQLNNNRISDDGAVALGEALRENSTMTSLNVETNVIGPHGAKYLREALCKNNYLGHVSFDGNPSD